MRRANRSLIFFSVALIMTFSAGAAPIAPSPLDERSSGIRVMNKVGLDLLREIIKSESKTPAELRNTMISPVSAFAALSMLHAGLRGETLKAFDAFLGLDRDFAENYNAQSSALLHSLQTRPAAGERPGTPKRPVIQLHNSAWATDGASTGWRFEFTPTFLTAISANYQASVTSLDFAQPRSADIINQWASVRTNGMIRDVISPETLRDLVWLLVNATYFESNWAAKFLPIKALEAPRFQLLDGSRVAVDMVKSQGVLNFLETSESLAVEIPFYDSNISLFVVMPQRSQDFARWTLQGTYFNSSQWTALTSAFMKYEASPAAGGTEVTLQMPKLNFAFSRTLTKSHPLTQSLGLSFLFNETNSQDFAPMGGIAGQAPGSTVGIFRQDTKIELDENGVKAAAITQIGGIRATSRPPPRRKKDLVIDKPYVFFIGAKRSQALLFAGTVVDPSRN